LYKNPLPSWRYDSVQRALPDDEKPGGFQETSDDEKDKYPYPLYKYHLNYLRCRMYLTPLDNTAQSSVKTGLETKNNCILYNEMPSLAS
jgi:hypothetical protein